MNPDGRMIAIKTEIQNKKKFLQMDVFRVGQQNVKLK